MSLLGPIFGQQNNIDLPSTLRTRLADRDQFGKSLNASATLPPRTSSPSLVAEPAAVMVEMAPIRVKSFNVEAAAAAECWRQPAAAREGGRGAAARAEQTARTPNELFIVKTSYVDCGKQGERTGRERPERGRRVRSQRGEGHRGLNQVKG